MIVPPKEFRVLLIGDACHDVYVFVHKDPNRNNPETDAPLVVEYSRLINGGMGRNVLSALVELGLTVTPILPQVQSEKVRIVDVDSGEQYMRIDKDIEPSAPASIDNVDFSIFNAVVISDYNKGFVTDEVIKDVISKYQGPIFLDTKKTGLKEYVGCIIKINSKEFSDLNYDSKVSLPANTIITLGSGGAYITGNPRRQYKALKVECVDVCGAGDAFLAGLVLGFLRTNSLEEALPYGIVNSGISVTKRGTCTPKLKELEKGLVDYAEQAGH